MKNISLGCVERESKKRKEREGRKDEGRLYAIKAIDYFHKIKHRQKDRVKE